MGPVDDVVVAFELALQLYRIARIQRNRSRDVDVVFDVPSARSDRHQKTFVYAAARAAYSEHAHDRAAVTYFIVSRAGFACMQRLRESIEARGGAGAEQQRRRGPAAELHKSNRSKNHIGAGD